MTVIDITNHSNDLFRRGVRYAAARGITPLTLWREIDFLRDTVTRCIREGDEQHARTVTRWLASMARAILES